MKKIIALLALIPSLVLVDTMTIECTYKEYAQPDGLHTTENDFILKFLIDKETGKSYIMGNNGSAEVISTGTEELLTFLEVTGAKKRHDYNSGNQLW
ncbi:hypothetical protein DA096_10350 [Vibrio rotiferianus]|uniref:hypothetical protein n=1 Tax=Vibrio rotiferianus TaxID=190895 RepID=UPI001110C176|nr:hypothetical protein [Vibrio rotiferianus]TMX33490.1 hypothetical protein DA095_17505 [Vibrio rotiferianus]TMX48238.1 hypothetical protein DA093_16935 [Vibrio rotiferianus]TMX61563.1 hypothetical protein DA097_15595 [Vibrio rotiferianus]TMX64158.1 hypothetical protein DA096_10350 [Vibrio rotiferianus]